MFAPSPKSLLFLFLLPFLQEQATATPPANLPHRWTLEEFGGVLSVGLEGHRSFAKGKALFHSAKCADCHHFASFGKGSAPDLTKPARFYTPEELLHPILASPAHIKNNRALTDFLSQEQLLDLLAFLLSGADPNSSLFWAPR